MRDAVRLDPFSIAANQMLVWALVAARRYDEAIQKCTLLVEMEPSFARSHTLMGIAYTLAGLHREGIRRVAKALRLPGGQSFLPSWAAAVCVYTIAGAERQGIRASQALEEKAQMGISSSYWQAVAQAHLGNERAAMRLLKEAVSMKDPWVTAAGYDPLAEPLRNQPRFSDVMRETGLAEFTN
jgi:tetratricopeptide (TPR) repeat protein